jgi:hypothetical protein
MYTKETTLQTFYLFRRLDTKECEEENIYPSLSFSLSLSQSVYPRQTQYPVHRIFYGSVFLGNTTT